MLYSLFALVGCITQVGNGDEQTEARSLADFVEVHNTTSVWVETRVGGDGFAVAATCDSNLLEILETEVNNGELTVRTPNRVQIRPRADCGVTVEMPELWSASGSGSGSLSASGHLIGFREGHNTGSGSLDLSGIDSETVDLGNTGSGELSAAGITVELDVDNTGSGSVDARDLVAEHVVVDNTGSGHVSVTATKSADVDVPGSGGVDVYGDPRERDQNITGSGHVDFH